MGATGLWPDVELGAAVRVAKERLEAFDRLMAEGGIPVVIDALAPPDRVRVIGADGSFVDIVNVGAP